MYSKRGLSSKIGNYVALTFVGKVTNNLSLIIKFIFSSPTVKDMFVKEHVLCTVVFCGVKPEVNKNLPSAGSN